MLTGGNVGPKVALKKKKDEKKHRLCFSWEPISRKGKIEDTSESVITVVMSSVSYGKCESWNSGHRGRRVLGSSIDASTTVAEQNALHTNTKQACDQCDDKKV